MTKQANPEHPIHELITKRWSPYGFDSRSVPREELLSLFEAARWSASSYNEQPWSFIVATNDDPDEFEKLLSCLVEGNQAWAKSAPVLVLCCTKLDFERNGKPNGAALHDLGLAAATLTFEATARELFVHQMIGILPTTAREVYEIPEGVLPLTALAIGYPADPSSLPENLKERDSKPRQRKALSDFVFEGKWGEATKLTY